MARKWVISVFILSLLFSPMAPPAAWAGGSGGEPLISDAVGWGIVGVLVIVGICAVYAMKREQPPAAGQPKDQAHDDCRPDMMLADRVTPRGDLVIATW
jgi:hypothetical protein